jgi:hypothetical protein
MRIFAPLFALLFAAVAWATPLDYTLMCDDAIIGALSVTDEGLHAMLLEGATCDPADLAVLEDEFLVVTLIEEVDGTFTVTLGEGVDALTATADEVPQQALDGRLGAFEQRAAAFARAALGGDGAGAGVEGAGEQADGAAESALERRPETPAGGRP